MCVYTYILCYIAILLIFLFGFLVNSVISYHFLQLLANNFYFFRHSSMISVSSSSSSSSSSSNISSSSSSGKSSW